MSTAEKLTGKAISWIPVVIAMIVADAIVFSFQATKLVGWMVLSIGLGLPVWEIISKILTKRTLSQNLEKFPTKSVRDYLLYFVWHSLMILSMVSLAFTETWTPGIISLVFAIGILIWGKQYCMAGYVLNIVAFLLGFQWYSHHTTGLWLNELIAQIPSWAHFGFVSFMTLSMVWLGFHTWERLE